MWRVVEYQTKRILEDKIQTLRHAREIAAEYKEKGIDAVAERYDSTDDNDN